MDFRLCLTALLLATTLAHAQQTSTPASPLTQALAGKTPPGYLAGQPPVDMVKLLPPPPVHDSPLEIADRAVYAAAALGIDGPAWKAAQTQLMPLNAQFMETLSSALGVKVSAQTTPATMKLLSRLLADFLPPMNAAKNLYQRPRPFTTDNGRACDPLVAQGQGNLLGMSYPSGHSGLGWLWALVLSDAAPAKKEPLRNWGMEVGQHRLDCRVHWASDVAAGRILAVAVYDRISATTAYQEDVQAAAAELR